jgi:tRNA dimethylallyltransferase
MIQLGLVRETQELLETGYGPELPAMSSIGYKQIALMLNGDLSEEEAVEQIKTETHRFIRHQYAWFKLTDPRIHWFDTGSEIDQEVIAVVADFLSS